MKINDTGLHNSDFLMDLTYQSTFRALDDRFVNAVANVLHTHNVQLYIGHFLNDPMPTLIAEYQVSTESDPDSIHKTILPIHLVSGKTLSLMVDAEPSDEEAMQLVQLVAVYVNQHEHLSRSNKDLLTGLKSRRSFEMEYHHQLIEGRNQNSSYVLALLNVDHFHNVNHECGRVIGDEMLIALANLMKDHFERDDFIYRFSGDEFVVLLRKNSSCADGVLEKLVNLVSEHIFPQVGKLTMRGGYLLVDFEVDSTLLFARASAALEYAKKQGGNCICCYNDLVEQGAIEAVDWKLGSVDLF